MTKLQKAINLYNEVEENLMDLNCLLHESFSYDDIRFDEVDVMLGQLQSISRQIIIAHSRREREAV